MHIETEDCHKAMDAVKDWRSKSTVFENQTWKYARSVIKPEANELQLSAEEFASDWRPVWAPAEEANSEDLIVNWNLHAANAPVRSAEKSDDWLPDNEDFRVSIEGCSG